MVNWMLRCAGVEYRTKKEGKILGRGEGGRRGIWKGRREGNGREGEWGRKVNGEGIHNLRLHVGYEVHCEVAMLLKIPSVLL